MVMLNMYLKFQDYILPYYAIKYNSTNDKSFLDFIQNTIKTWKSQNPFLQTINWTSGISSNSFC